jgi:hypothetical protein
MQLHPSEYLVRGKGLRSREAGLKHGLDTLPKAQPCLGGHVGWEGARKMQGLHLSQLPIQHHFPLPDLHFVWKTTTPRLDWGEHGFLQ